MILSVYISINVDPDAVIPVEYRIYVILGILILLVSVITEFVLMISYMAFSVPKNKYLNDSSKFVWVLLLWFLNVFAVPIYWYKYIRDK